MIYKNKILEYIEKRELLEYLNNTYVDMLHFGEKVIYRYIKNIFINKKDQITIQLENSICVPFAHSQFNSKMLKFFKYYENTNQLVLIAKNQTYNDLLNLFRIYNVK